MAAAPFFRVHAAKLNVVTTTTMVTDMVKEIGGDRVKVFGLMGPGVDPHLYKPASGDVVKLQRAKVIFYSGLMLEGRMTDLFFRMARTGKLVYAVTESISEKDRLEPPEFSGHWDPHVWGNPILWSQCVVTVVDGLSKADPVGAAEYAKRGKSVVASYKAMKTWALKRVAAVPRKQRILVTSHDAFNYFGQAFGFQVVALQGLSTVTEAGLADIAKTVDFIKEKKIKAIFVESSVNPAAIERVSKDAGVRIGGELFSDACGKVGDIHEAHGEKYDVGTFVGMLKHNINTVVDALK
ncbi:MAG: zinc ABC transporter substrate-binding protein [Verrucomicrobiota bacterium]|nr:zinc ABC transporter substrate-binding protein [Verrucomicrobiota bacterium]MDP7291229.1 zinc ABC transporter substrate-binding protein [Verrucomicrobiota bacterium]MDP7441243.1 zinc ABC transporter substrate-binding protein [Verrucomicrobiota bacterium]HJN82041.1 zinc ABC transporter substrate-binding protein [Verrucomicrobiota bacterium]